MRVRARSVSACRFTARTPPKTAAAEPIVPSPIGGRSGRSGGSAWGRGARNPREICAVGHHSHLKPCPARQTLVGRSASGLNDRPGPLCLPPGSDRQTNHAGRRRIVGRSDRVSDTGIGAGAVGRGAGRAVPIDDGAERPGLRAGLGERERPRVCSATCAPALAAVHATPNSAPTRTPSPESRLAGAATLTTSPVSTKVFITRILSRRWEGRSDAPPLKRGDLAVDGGDGRGHFLVGPESDFLIGKARPLDPGAPVRHKLRPLRFKVRQRRHRYAPAFRYAPRKSIAPTAKSSPAATFTACVSKSRSVRTCGPSEFLPHNSPGKENTSEIDFDFVDLIIGRQHEYAREN